jgi:outer membrane murein-binding lipoprotein Lpp
MSTRDVVLVGAVLVVGYLLVGYLNKSKNNSQLSSNVDLDSNNEINIDCEAKWQEKAKTIKGTPEFLLKEKNDFLSTCK